MVLGPSEAAPPTFDSSLLGIVPTPTNVTSLTARSLGGRSLRIPNADNLYTIERLEREISARLYFHPWTATAPVSLIPDVTWTGSDWVIVSPSVARISSDTGTYYDDGGGNFYLIDPSFYFGNDANAVDGSSSGGPFLHKTLDLTTDRIYFPDAGAGFEYQQAVEVVSEHVIRFASAVPGLAIGGIYPWSLVRGATALSNEAGNIKNPGFRVNARGEVLVMSSFFTFANSAPDTDLTTPRVTETLNRRLWGDAHFSPGVFETNDVRYGSGYNAWNDTISTARIAADLTYRGISVGAPKGCTEINPDEPPMMAISWGENFYGFLDRHTAGLPGNVVNETHLFRQSFGPWRSGVKDMSIVGGSALTGSSNALSVLSREHVFTRHGYTVSSQSGFATDGYRNCHVHLSSQFMRGSNMTLSGVLDVATGDPRADENYEVNVSAVYTDALGKDAIRIRGSAFPWNETRDPVNGVVGAGNNSSPVLFGQGNNNLNAATPQVIWNGKDFVAFVSGTNILCDVVALVATATLPRVRGTISMVVFPGDENKGALDDSLTGDSISNGVNYFGNLRSPKIAATSMVTCGAGQDYDMRDFTVLDVAYSGKVYCVVWAMGFNNAPSPDSNATGGSMIGYTIFPEAGGSTEGIDIANPGLPNTFNPGGAQSYVIEAHVGSSDNSDDKARYVSPKVVWDGKQFFVSFLHLLDTSGTNVLTPLRVLSQIVVNEDGSGVQPQIRMAAGFGTIDPTSTARTLGHFTVGGGYGVLVGTNGFKNNALLPGDIMVITNTSDAAGTVFSASGAGVYTVVDFDPKDLGIDLGVNFDTSGVANNDKAYGMVLSGGMGTTFDANLNSFASGTGNHASIVASQQAPSITFSSLAATSDIARLWDIAVNEKDGEYVFLVEGRPLGGSYGLWLLLYKKSQWIVTKEVEVDNGSWTSAAISWNGDKYLVVYGDETDIYSALYSSNLVLAQSGPSALASVTDMIGNTDRKMPGAGYETYDAALPVKAHIRKLDLVWNNRLNRWAMSVSCVWYNSAAEDTVYRDTYQLSAIAYPDVPTVTTWNADRTLTLSAATSTMHQPGQRLLAHREETIIIGLAGATIYGLNTLTDPAGDFINDGVVYGDILIVTSAGFAADYRRIVSVTATAITIEGMFTSPPVVPTAYVVNRPSRIELESNATAGPQTYTVTTLTDGSKNFITAGVAPGDAIYLDGVFLVEVTAVAATVLTFIPTFAPSPAPGAGTAYSVQRHADYTLNLIAGTTSEYTVDVGPNEVRILETLSGDTAYKLYHMPREDVFVWTLGSTSPAVQIEDADDVSLTNVEISGSVDIEERYKRIIYALTVLFVVLWLLHFFGVFIHR